MKPFLAVLNAITLRMGHRQNADFATAARRLFFLMGLFLLLSDWLSAQYLPVKEKGLWGMIDTTGKIVLPIAYEARINYAGSFGFVTTLNKQNGVMNLAGHTVLEHIYKSIIPDRNGLLWARTFSDSVCVFTEKGQLLAVNPPCNSLEALFEDTYAFTERGKWGVIHLNKGTILPAVYDKVERIGVAIAVCKDSVWGAYTDKGSEVLPMEYQQIDSGPPLPYFLAKQYGLWGIVKVGGEWLVQPMYDQMTIIGEYALAKRGKETDQIHLVENTEINPNEQGLFVGDFSRSKKVDNSMTFSGGTNS